jgi:antitoxin ParD1/3/4
MTSMNISLPEALNQYVEGQTHKGYSTANEYVRELIREDQKRRSKEQLDTLLLEGLNSGEPIPANARFWRELKRDALARLGARKKTRK